ncbi:hypothetical protein [Corynebacterium pseudotuberculosis]|uniref:hypothetical protein n=1 Tax=Corynebacterium pseudotuberculosis TaxID=1719 RepID=UPI000245A3D8|nr:hypothetical protein [Corynebacterium pseudotuberculosis]AEX38587.1 Hypothetical protein Cp3995_0109 [Corynebacterium pseudotuberculosis 3/99-5]
MISIIDVRGAAPDHTVVLWHVHTDPSYPTGLMSGAWVLGPGEATPVDKLPSLLTGTTALPLNAEARELVPGDITCVSLRDVADAVRTGLDEVKKEAARAKSENEKLVTPRFEALTDISPEDFLDAYRGEPQARDAWMMASAVAGWMQQWLDIESVRRSRAYLKEAFGSEPRPLPIG